MRIHILPQYPARRLTILRRQMSWSPSNNRTCSVESCSLAQVFLIPADKGGNGTAGVRTLLFERKSRESVRHLLPFHLSKFFVR